MVLGRGLRGRRAAAASRPASSSSGTSRSRTATSRWTGTRSSITPDVADEAARRYRWDPERRRHVFVARAARGARRLCRPRRLERSRSAGSRSRCRCRFARASRTGSRKACPLPAPGTRVRVPFAERALTGVVLARARGRGPRDRTDDPRGPRRRARLPARASRDGARGWPSGSSRRPGRSSRARCPRGCRPRERCGTGSPTRARSARLPLRRKSAPSSSASPRARPRASPTCPARDAPRREALRALEEAGRVRPVAGSRAPRSARRAGVGAVARLDPTSARRRSGGAGKGREVLDYLEALGRPATTAELRLATGAGRRAAAHARRARACSAPSSRSGGTNAAVPPVAPASALRSDARPGRGTRGDHVRDPGASLLPGPSPGRDRQRKDRGLPAGDPRRARGRPRRRLARPRDRPDARLRPGAAPPVSGARPPCSTRPSRSASAPRPGTGCARARRSP